MRIRLNPRSLAELQQVMSILGENNPTHVLQQMITTFQKSLTRQSRYEENINGNQESKNLHPV